MKAETKARIYAEAMKLIHPLVLTFGVYIMASGVVRDSLTRIIVGTILLAIYHSITMHFRWNISVAFMEFASSNDEPQKAEPHSHRSPDAPS